MGASVTAKDAVKTFAVLAERTELHSDQIADLYEMFRNMQAINAVLAARVNMLEAAIETGNLQDYAPEAAPMPVDDADDRVVLTTAQECLEHIAQCIENHTGNQPEISTIRDNLYGQSATAKFRPVNDYVTADLLGYQYEPAAEFGGWKFWADTWKEKYPQASQWGALTASVKYLRWLALEVDGRTVYERIMAGEDWTQFLTYINIAHRLLGGVEN